MTSPAMRVVTGLLLFLTAAVAVAEDVPGRSLAPIPPLPASTLPPALTFTGKKFPPPGSAADQALLGDLLAAQASMLAQRAWAITATQRLADGGYDGRLAALQATQPPEAAGTTGSLRARLTAGWNDVAGIMTAQWPVDGRIGCRQQGINFEVLMPSVDPQASERLAATRGSARKCLERQKLVLRPLEKANRDLDVVWREAQALLAGAGGGK